MPRPLYIYLKMSSAISDVNDVNQQGEEDNAAKIHVILSFNNGPTRVVDPGYSKKIQTDFDLLFTNNAGEEIEKIHLAKSTVFSYYHEDDPIIVKVNEENPVVVSVKLCNDGRIIITTETLLD